MPSPIFNVGTATPPASTSKSLTGVVPHYQVQLHVRGDASLDSGGRKIFPIVANLPERINMEFTSNWDTPFAQTSLGDLASAATKGRFSPELLNQGLSATGIGRNNKAQTAQVWQSSSPMNFNIEMVFRAVQNSETEVRDRHIALLKLAAPSELAAGFLRPPGPNIRSVLQDKIVSDSDSRIITIYVGKYIKLDNVIITSVSSDVTCLFDQKGIPQAMTVSVGVQSFFSCFTTNDIDDMFTVNP